jgi:arginine repressor
MSDLSEIFLKISLIKTTSKRAQLKKIIPAIEEARRDGVSRQELLQILKETGFEISQAALDNRLKRYRQQIRSTAQGENGFLEPPDNKPFGPKEEQLKTPYPLDTAGSG